MAISADRRPNVPNLAVANPVIDPSPARRSMPDVWGGECLPLVHLAQIKLQLAIFNGVGRQLVGAHLDIAPFEALADVPDLVAAGAPQREMVVLALGLAQPLATDPFVGALPMAIGAGEVELADLEVRQLLAARVGRLRSRHGEIDLDR